MAFLFWENLTEGVYNVTKDLLSKAEKVEQDTPPHPLFHNPITLGHSLTLTGNTLRTDKKKVPYFFTQHTINLQNSLPQDKKRCRRPGKRTEKGNQDD